MNQRITPSNITNLEENQIFVFGSNLSGRHGAGAAKTALTWGAIYGQTKGLQGKTYAIPTKNASVTKPLTVNEIKPFVDEFINFATNNPHLTFLVTEIGCGLSNYQPKDIAPLFIDVININNIHLPYRFWETIEKYNNIK